MDVLMTANEFLYQFETVLTAQEKATVLRGICRTHYAEACYIIKNNTKCKYEELKKK